MCAGCANHNVRGLGAEYVRDIDKLREFLLNGPGAIPAACAATFACYEVGHLLRPFADLLTEIICAVVLLAVVVLLLSRRKPSRLVVR